MKCFPNTSFKEQVLALLLIFTGESFLGGMEIWTPLYLLWIHSLTSLGKFQQKILKFRLEYIFFAMTLSVTLTTHRCKSRAQTTQVL